MKESISLELQKHYANTFKNYGESPKGVDWRDSLTADIRYSQMQKLFRPISSHTKLLDVGCGYGGFKNFLDQKRIDIIYTGIDIVQEMLDAAKKKYPNATLICEDFIEKKFLDHFEYSVCNGILTQKLEASSLEMETYVKKIIKKMFEISTIGCAFNVMTSRSNFFSANLFYCSPAEILSYCLSEITPNVKLDHSYGLYEFTIYLYKSNEYNLS